MLVTAITSATLVSCTGADGEADQASTTTEPFTMAAGEFGPEQIGLCFADDVDDFQTPQSIAISDCAAGHTLEVAAIVDAPFDLIPEDTFAAAGAACVAPSEAYMRASFLESGLTLATFLEGNVGEAPSGSLICFIKSPVAQGLRGSLATTPPSQAMGDVRPIGAMAVGDCYTPEKAVEAAHLGKPTRCTTGSAHEVIDQAQLGDSGYPGVEELHESVQNHCGFEPSSSDEVTGTERASSVTAGAPRRGFVVPSAERWAWANDRQLTCFAIVPA